MKSNFLLKKLESFLNRKAVLGNAGEAAPPQAEPIEDLVQALGAAEAEEASGGSGSLEDMGWAQFEYQGEVINGPQVAQMLLAEEETSEDATFDFSELPMFAPSLEPALAAFLAKEAAPMGMGEPERAKGKSKRAKYDVAKFFSTLMQQTDTDAQFVVKRLLTGEGARIPNDECTKWLGRPIYMPGETVTRLGVTKQSLGASPQQHTGQGKSSGSLSRGIYEARGGDPRLGLSNKIDYVGGRTPENKAIYLFGPLDRSAFVGALCESGWGDTLRGWGFDDEVDACEMAAASAPEVAEGELSSPEATPAPQAAPDLPPAPGEAMDNKESALIERIERNAAAIMASGVSLEEVLSGVADCDSCVEKFLTQLEADAQLSEVAE